MNTELILEINEDCEMAQILQGKRCLRMGNYWDFHAGCHGTEITFEDGSSYDFEKEWTNNVRTPNRVVRMICDKFGFTYKERKTSKEFW